MFFSFVTGILTVILAFLPCACAEQNLTEAQLAIIVQRLEDVASHSWEYGTLEQTLLELDTPSFSVFSDAKLPPPHSAPDSLTGVINVITQIVKNRSGKLATGNYSGPQPLFPGEGSSADPASNGVAALIANWTRQSNGDVDFGAAAKDQMAFLWSSAVPKTPDGAISHRTEQVQLWSDFIYMVPPFLAYYGVLSKNRTMVSEAYHQISLYRNYLRDPLKGNLWKHVLLGSWEDEGYWSTGNGWAAAGMLRVLGTIKNSKYARSMETEMFDLVNWVSEIHDAMYPYMRDDGMFHNYPNNNTTLVDASSATLLAATVYRHALLSGVHKHIPDAEYVRRKLWAPTSGEGNNFTDPSSTKDMVHFTSDGFLTPVVNPNDFSLAGEKSPEGQAFVVQMYMAWKDWVADGSQGADGADKDVINIDVLRHLVSHKNRMEHIRRSKPI